jgi:hypothetical protein
MRGGLFVLRGLTQRCATASDVGQQASLEARHSAVEFS